MLATTKQFAQRAAIVALTAVALAADPGTAHAQFFKKLKDKATSMVGGTAAAADSVKAKADSVANASSKISETASKLSSAADAISSKTGVSKETMVNAALAASGAGLVGAALHPGSITDKATAGLSGAKSVIGAMKQAQGLNIPGVSAAPGVDVSAYRGAALAYQQQAMQAQQASMEQAMQILQATANDSSQTPQVRAAAQQQLAMYQLALRAQQGDTGAVRQLMELQQQFAAQYNAQAAAMYGAQLPAQDSAAKPRAKSARKP